MWSTQMTPVPNLQVISNIFCGFSPKRAQSIEWWTDRPTDRRTEGPKDWRTVGQTRLRRWVGAPKLIFSFLLWKIDCRITRPKGASTRLWQRRRLQHPHRRRRHRNQHHRRLQTIHFRKRISISLWKNCRQKEREEEEERVNASVQSPAMCDMTSNLIVTRNAISHVTGKNCVWHQSPLVLKMPSQMWRVKFSHGINYKS